jgi:hypothetical protein
MAAGGRSRLRGCSGHGREALIEPSGVHQESRVRNQIQNAELVAATKFFVPPRS